MVSPFSRASTSLHPLNLFTIWCPFVYLFIITIVIFFLFFFFSLPQPYMHTLLNLIIPPFVELTFPLHSPPLPFANNPLISSSLLCSVVFALKNLFYFFFFIFFLKKKKENPFTSTTSLPPVYSKTTTKNM